MRGDSVPDSDHVVRYCPFKHILEDGSISGPAFLLGRDHDHLSVNWLEFLAANSESEAIQALREVLASKLTLRKSAQMAVLNVGEVREHVEQEDPGSRNLEILHWPDDEYDDPSHSGIFGYTLEDLGIALLIAQKVRATYPALDNQD